MHRNRQKHRCTLMDLNFTWYTSGDSGTLLLLCAGGSHHFETTKWPCTKSCFAWLASVYAHFPTNTMLALDFGVMCLSCDSFGNCLLLHQRWSAQAILEKMLDSMIKCLCHVCILQIRIWQKKTIASSLEHSTSWAQLAEYNVLVKFVCKNGKKKKKNMFEHIQTQEAKCVSLCLRMLLCKHVSVQLCS